MDDMQFGKRNKKGDWSPNDSIKLAPYLTWPSDPRKYLSWLVSYFFPWNAVFICISLIEWFFLTPSIDTMKSLQVAWIIYLLARNMLLILIFYGLLEIRLYIQRVQGNRFKFNAKWPSEQPSKVFLLKNQNIDNFIRTFASGIPIWTAYEVFGLWCYANNWGAWGLWSNYPFWFPILAFTLPVYHELHFYCIHRLIHFPILYKLIHSVHHNSVNPSPWSSLSMHPIEHLLYWSDSLIHLIVPSHPLLFLYNLQITGTGAVVGHVGFDKMEFGENSKLDTHAYAHYLHHKYFEVNYADGATGLDKFFGTWHDGSEEAQMLMEARYAAKVAKQNQEK